MKMSPNKTLLALALTVGGLSAAQAQEPNPTPQAQAATALHLLEGGRFSEAIPAAQALADLAPNDAVSYQIRGAISLYIGSPNAAQADFANAAKLAPNNAATQYGRALSALATKRTGDAQGVLTSLRATPGLSPAQAADTDTLLAYLTYIGGDYAGAQTLAGTSLASGDGVRQELQALIAAHTQPEQGAELLTAFLTRPSGVPQVVEDGGVRPLFEATPSVVEPSVVEPTLQAMYRVSLATALARAARQAKGAAHLSGDVTLEPGAARADRAMVAFYIDGQMAAMVNTAPYAQTWRTATSGNGWHTVRTDVLNASGDVVATTSRRVSVLNDNAAAPDAGLAADADLETRVWNALRLRPSRKVAEWTLANLLDRQGDHAGAGAHRAVAAALDANYKDARRVAQSVFGGTTPALRAVAAAQPQGLSSGSAARRQVALTFDDGPNPLKTPALLDALDKADAPATFFVVGARAEAAPDLVRRMAARGDDVEDHSYTHPNMAQSPPAVAEAEILRTSVVIRALAGQRPRFFRPPGGNRNLAVYHLSHQYGQTVALWTADAVRFEESGSPQALINYVVGHAQPGCIVLMHNGMDTTTAAIPGLIAALRAKGYQLVTLTQMTSGVTPATTKAALIKKPRPAIP